MNYVRSRRGAVQRVLDLCAAGLVVATITACAANVGADTPLEEPAVMIDAGPRIAPASWREHIDDGAAFLPVVYRRSFTWTSR